MGMQIRTCVDLNTRVQQMRRIAKFKPEKRIINRHPR